MPIVTATLLPGYPPEVEARLVSRLATATRSVIAASAEGTTVYVSHASTYQRGGEVLASGAGHRPVAGDIAVAFLRAMDCRRADPTAGRLERHGEVIRR